MGNVIRWLHLTDLHVGMKDQEWLWPTMEKKFRESLQEIYTKAEPWDLVLFTGDLVQKGTDFAKVDEIFDTMWGWFHDLGCDPKLLAVPGNHDLQRPDVEQSTVMVLEDWATKPEVRERFWTQPHGELRQVIKNAFADYDRWWRNTSRKPDGICDGLLPGDFSFTFTKGDLHLGIVGLNSAFLQLTDKEDYRRRLSLHPRQFRECCQGNGVRWADSHHACILMTHHPPEWLDDESQKHLQGEILENFCLHLCGHNHETKVRQELSGGASHATLRWLGRSLFGLEKCKDGQLDRSHGYAAGQLRKGKANKGSLRFTPRWRVEQDGTWKLVPDQCVTLPDHLHTRLFQIPLRKVTTAPARSPQPTRKPPEQARQVFRRVVDEITGVLNRTPQLRNELERALQSDNSEIRAAATDIIDLIFAEGLYQVLVRLVAWLRSPNARGYHQQLTALVGAFSALGIPPARIDELREKLDSGRIDIDATSTPAMAAMIAAALFDAPVEWIEGRNRDPVPASFVCLSGDEVPYAGNERESILFELKKRLLSSSVVDLRISPEHPKASKHLQERLKGLHDLGTPVLTILREDEAVLAVMEGDTSVDWRKLLVFRAKSDVDDVMPEAISVATVVQGILKELRRLEGATNEGTDLA
jgi:hypothetical protein